MGNVCELHSINFVEFHNHAFTMGNFNNIETLTPVTKGAVFGVTTLCILATIVLIITVACIFHSKKRRHSELMLLQYQLLYQ